MNAYCQEILNGIDRATAGMSGEDMTRHPEGKWCAAEILEHLSIAFGSTAKGLRRVLDGEKPVTGRLTAFQRVGQFLIIGMGVFPPNRKAPEFTRPKGAPAEETQRTIRENLVVMDATLQECEERFGTKVKIADHPVLGAFSVEQWRRFHAVHTRHHMKQIARLRQN